MFDVGIAMQNLVLAACSLGWAPFTSAWSMPRKLRRPRAPLGIVFVEMTRWATPTSSAASYPGKISQRSFLTRSTARSRRIGLCRSLKPLPPVFGG